MMFVAPCRLMSSRASCIEPSPKAISAMTAAVPMMMPSTDRNARSLCSHRLRTARTKPRRLLSQFRIDGSKQAATISNADSSDQRRCWTWCQIARGFVACACVMRSNSDLSSFRVVGLDHAVAKANHAACPGGDVVFVRDHDDRLAGLVEAGAAFP